MAGRRVEESADGRVSGSGILIHWFLASGTLRVASVRKRGGKSTEESGKVSSTNDTRYPLATFRERICSFLIPHFSFSRVYRDFIDARLSPAKRLIQFDYSIHEWKHV